jgi:hypothetical protein
MSVSKKDDKNYKENAVERWFNKGIEQGIEREKIMFL